MYFIRKYSNGWAIHDDDTGASRLLTIRELIALTGEFPALADEDLRTVYADEIRSIEIGLPPAPPLNWKEQTYL